ncbi:MAG TPA: hypothetical protein IGS40_16645 [Trichormus sp. M33_DOE_039]|nr:hypothetical protein [Trichormus sp. M33_DOE_039]
MKFYRLLYHIDFCLEKAEGNPDQASFTFRVTLSTKLCRWRNQGLMLQYRYPAGLCLPIIFKSLLEKYFYFLTIFTLFQYAKYMTFGDLSIFHMVTSFWLC